MTSSSNCACCRRSRVLRLRQVKVHHHQAVSWQSEIDRLQSENAANEQPRRRDGRHREGDLRDDERSTPAGRSGSSHASAADPQLREEIRRRGQQRRADTREQRRGECSRGREHDHDPVDMNRLEAR